VHSCDILSSVHNDVSKMRGKKVIWTEKRKGTVDSFLSCVHHHVSPSFSFHSSFTFQHKMTCLGTHRETKNRSRTSAAPHHIQLSACMPTYYYCQSILHDPKLIFFHPNSEEVRTASWISVNSTVHKPCLIYITLAIVRIHTINWVFIFWNSSRLAWFTQPCNHQWVQ